jgi:hypothetical protein
VAEASRGGGDAERGLSAAFLRMSPTDSALRRSQRPSTSHKVRLIPARQMRAFKSSRVGWSNARRLVVMAPRTTTARSATRLTIAAERYAQREVRGDFMSFSGPLSVE